jgi:ATP-dependent Clp protease, protease subunit
MPKIKHLIFHGPINDKTANKLLASCLDSIKSNYQSIYISISSGGGLNESGSVIFNFLKSSPIPITTHNIGVIDSIANVVFLAGTNRYCCEDTSFLIHGTTRTFNKEQSLTQWQLIETINALSNDQNKMAEIILKNTKIEKNELTSWFLKGETITPERAVSLGIVTEVRPVPTFTDSSIVTTHT